jgi:hypothetical protein
MIPLRTIEEQEAWAADYAYWRDLPLPDKTRAVITAINESGSDRAKIYEALRKSVRYPFTHDDFPDSTPDICVLGGRINLPTKRLVDWRIWKSEHSVQIITW